jgi:hypothetical protein
VHGDAHREVWSTFRNLTDAEAAAGWPYGPDPVIQFWRALDGCVDEYDRQRNEPALTVLPLTSGDGVQR